jgi:uncharacterized membrane protein
VSKSRLEAFSDGVFAVAITLLVFNIVVPNASNGHLRQALLDEWPAFASYAVSFVTIGIIWVNHHGTLERIRLVDRPLLFINLFLLMTVAFLPFPTSLLSHYIESGDAKVAAFVYACTMTAMAVAFNAIWIYAIWRGLLDVDRIDMQKLHAAIPRFGAGLLVYVVAIGFSQVSPKLDLALFAVVSLYYVFEQQVDLLPEEPQSSVSTSSSTDRS